MAENKNDLVSKYLKSVASKFAHKETSEMGYRTDFEILLNGIFESIKVQRIGHDERAAEGNKPDFVVINNSVPILYIETKDIGISLDKVEKSEQMARYYGYTNLVLTDYLEFRFYRNGVSYEEPIKIASFDKENRTISPLPENYEQVAKTLVDFTQSQKEPIKSGEHLAKIMGGKAQRIRDNIRHYLSSDRDSKKNAGLLRVYETIKKLLVHDLTVDTFADMYAQTLVYGLFVARYNDETPDTFSRQEARDLVPASNPFLRHFFDHIAGADYDDRLKYIVDELCIVFLHANVQQLMSQYFKIDIGGQEHASPDPVIHFYEDFLKEYDPELRKKMGAYYTPLPVVNFIVRSVDYILQKEFGLPNGLADSSKLSNGKHRVQILDPAVGTGTFISATIDTIYKRLIEQGQKGRWTTYVHNDLLPRLHGFEIMMTPYTIAHLKLSMAFKKTGFKIFNNRLGIYLTNSLEQTEVQQDMLSFGLAESIAEEAKEASKIKNETPIMVVIGNPPYSGESSNASYTGNDVYKVEPTGGRLQERNSKWLNDDYVKFIRYAESMIEKTGEGIVAMITAHGYIDNPTFRGMRFRLMKTFDEIYVLDLHGNANKQEKTPKGADDKNVFDIKTGVSIFVGLKKKNSKNNQAKIFHADCYGSRSDKFKYLDSHSIDSVGWKTVCPIEPNYEWIARNEAIREQYGKGFSVAELFPVSSVGVVTSRDDFIVDFDRETLEKRVKNFLCCQSPQEAKSKYSLKENAGWKIAEALKHDFNSNNTVSICYRPFDTRFVYYHKDFIERMRKEVMRHLIVRNIGLVTVNRSPANMPSSYYFIANGPLVNGYIRSDSVSIDTVFPLYLCADDARRVANTSKVIVDAIERIVKKSNPEDIFDYIYAVLHSPSYREKYKEFLKIDFPRVPYPKDAKTFNGLVKLGAELRGLHLLESPKVEKYITTFPVEGSDTVDKLTYKDSKVFINATQYFGKVPEIAWNFYIGGYQPAQKWLKDRKGRKLSNEDIEHYQKIVVALTETDKIMKEIDEIDFLGK